MDYKGKNVLVIGLARAGKSATKVLLEKGARVIAVDIKKRELLEGLNDIEDLGAEVITGCYSTDIVKDIDLVVKSPGVEMSDVLVVEALNKGIPVIDEIEFAYQNLNVDKVIAVTGTNGKSTTVSLIGHILNTSGKKTIVAGNIGDPLSAHIGERAEFAVLEVSTFQLEAIGSLRPDIGILLNITPDHLTRHKTMDNYINLKFRLFNNQNREDIAILNKDDEIIWKKKDEIRAKIIPFTKGRFNGIGSWVDDDCLFLNIGNGEVKIIERSELPLLGPHNLENYLASTLTCYLSGVDSDNIVNCIKTFRGLAHRMEFLGIIGGVSFYNDSKATNPVSMEMALRSFDSDIVLIAGGRDKGTDFNYLRDLVSERVKVVVLIGESAEKMGKAFEGVVKIIFADDIDIAVRMAYREANGSGVVLLSPGCTSFDMFADFEDRGEKFRCAFENLREEVI
ncbi:MAG: UDP-N-acetylmuramoyl-L-alanine--D-glutamate ligase [bacterium]